jgi:hypothetical protein
MASRVHTNMDMQNEWCNNLNSVKFHYFLFCCNGKKISHALTEDWSQQGDKNIDFYGD